MVALWLWLVMISIFPFFRMMLVSRVLLLFGIVSLHRNFFFSFFFSWVLVVIVIFYYGLFSLLRRGWEVVIFYRFVL